MRLIDDEQTHPGDELGQLFFAEAWIVQPFRGHQQHVHLIRGKLLPRLLPLVLVRRVDGHRPDAGAFSGRHLVPHQRQQRRNDQCRTGAARTHQQTRDEIDGGFSPAGALYHQRAPPSLDKGLDGLILPRVEVSGFGPDQFAQQFCRPDAQMAICLRIRSLFRRRSCFSHDPSLPAATVRTRTGCRNCG